MKAIVISEKEHFLPWAVDSGIETRGLLLPEADNLLLKIENIGGAMQLHIFPQHQPGRNFKQIAVLEICDEKAEKLIELAKIISDTVIYLHLETMIGNCQK